MNNLTDLPPETRQRLSGMGINAPASQRTFMQQLASRLREPNKAETNVDELESAGETRAAAIAFFKRLADLGCGEFKAGRRGKDSRIVWKHSAISIAKAFLDDSLISPTAPASVRPGFADSGSATVNEASAAYPPDRASHDLGDSPEFHRHAFLLRPDLTVALELPLNLTKEEANRLAEFIRAIPF